MLVLKFGGTSVRDAERLRNAAAIVDERRDGGAVVVVSAAAGMTRRLLDLAAAAACGRWEAVEGELEAILALQRRIARDLDLKPDRHAHLAGRLQALVERLRVTLRDLGDRGDLDVDDTAPFAGHNPDPPADQERVGATGEDPAPAADHDRVDAASQDLAMSFGERFSSALIVAAGQRAGLPVEHVSALDVIVTDAAFRNAAPDRPAIERHAAERIAPLLADGAVVVTEGFIGATPEGEVTTMGFEASDLTATLLGAALDAEQVQIWTDVPGMLTTGHPSVPEPSRVPRLTYDEAAELALFGARVLHPDTVAPARAKGIPVRILHADDPVGEGTRITADPAGEDTRDTANAAGEGAVTTAGPAGNRAWLAAAAPAADGTPEVKAIAVAEDADDDSFATVRELLTRAGAGEPGNRAVVCPVGRGIGEARDIIRRVEGLLDGIPSATLLPRRPHAIPVVVSRRRVDEVVRRLHAALL